VIFVPTDNLFYFFADACCLAAPLPPTKVSSFDYLIFLQLLYSYATVSKYAQRHWVKRFYEITCTKLLSLPLMLVQSTNLVHYTSCALSLLVVNPHNEGLQQ